MGGVECKREKKNFSQTLSACCRRPRNVPPPSNLPPPSSRRAFVVVELTLLQHTPIEFLDIVQDSKRYRTVCFPFASPSGGVGGGGDVGRERSQKRGCEKMPILSANFLKANTRYVTRSGGCLLSRLEGFVSGVSAVFGKSLFENCVSTTKVFDKQ